MEVGVQLPEVERDVRWPEYLAMARAAEEVGLASIWLGDHLLYRVGSGVRAAIARSACAAASRFRRIGESIAAQEPRQQRANAPFVSPARRTRATIAVPPRAARRPRSPA